MDIQKQLDIIKNGVEEIVPEAELKQKLILAEKENRPLRVKMGIDPTGTDVHIGHMVPVRKMRDFQDMGHTGVIIIGDFTARIGDPTGRDESRPPLTAEQTKANAATYMEQLYTVLDKDKTEIRWQSEWFEGLNLADVINLLGKFTLAQFLAHDTFRKRYENGLPLAMHELMYPVLQAYDSVAIDADIELGATEQKFNLLCGRDMLRYFGKPEQVAIMFPILLGTDGVNKMSKSMGNYVAVFDKPSDKYGKVMSIPDEIILNYYKYATRLTPQEIKEIDNQLKSGDNPKFIKQRLAREIVKLYDGESAALEAEEEFNRVFSQRDIPTDIEEFVMEEPIWIVKLLTDTGLCQTNGEARRMLKQGAVKLDDEKVDDMDLNLSVDRETILKVGKRRFLKLVPKE